jgi:hypothetical protein
MQPKTETWTRYYRSMYTAFGTSKMRRERSKYGLSDNPHKASVRYADIRRDQKRYDQGRPIGGRTDPATIVPVKGTVRPELLTSTVPSDAGTPAPPPSVSTGGGGMTAGANRDGIARNLRGRVQSIMARMSDREAQQGGGMLAGIGARRAVTALRQRIFEKAQEAGVPAQTEDDAAELLAQAAAGLMAAAQAEQQGQGTVPELLLASAQAGDQAAAAALSAYLAAGELAADPAVPEVYDDITPAEAAALILGAGDTDAGDLVTVSAAELQELMQLTAECLQALGQPCACAA